MFDKRDIIGVIPTREQSMGNGARPLDKAPEMMNSLPPDDGEAFYTPSAQEFAGLADLKRNDFNAGRTISFPEDAEEEAETSILR